MARAIWKFGRGQAQVRLVYSGGHFCITAISRVKVLYNILRPLAAQVNEPKFVSFPALSLRRRFFSATEASMADLFES